MKGFLPISVKPNKQKMNNADVEKYRHDLEVIRNTAAQVIKDFELFGIEIKCSRDEYTAYNELKAQLIPVLQNLHKKNFSLFNSLLYRIDVSEKKIKETLMDFTGDQLSEQLAQLVIEREFAKVLFRKLHSKK